jgi:cobalt-zinc-cadmium efflux system membrane fusion protein
MKTITKLVVLLTIVGAAVGIVAIVENRSAKHEAELDKNKPQTHEPGVVHFDRGEPQLSAIRSEAVATEAMPAADPVNGRLVYDENVTARISSPIAGRVIALRAGVGDQVSRGAALLEIDSPDLAMAEAELSKATSEEARKRLAFERSKNLYDNEVIARKEFESAEADYRLAQADTRRTSQRLRNLQSSGHENGKFLLRSPLAGVVVERNVNPGQEIRPDNQAPLFLVTNTTQLWLLVDVPEKSLSHVHTGQKVSLETDAWPDQMFNATVERIGVAVDPVTRRVQVRCSIKNADLKLKPEMFARVSFLATGEVKGIRVHNTSLVTEGIHVYVFVETEPSTFHKRQVKLALRGNDHSFVESGLAEGERVVVEGALLLNSEAAADAQ